MHAIRQAIERWLGALGVPGILGVGLLLFCMGMYESSIAPATQRLDAVNARIAKLDWVAQPNQRTIGPLSEFYGFFPPEKDLSAAMERIYAVADREGLDLPKGEYRLTRGNHGQIASVQAVFPVRGNYAQVRRFVAAVLNEFPYVALDDLRLEKQRAADAAIDSQVKLTLFFRTQ